MLSHAPEIEEAVNILVPEAAIAEPSEEAGSPKRTPPKLPNTEAVITAIPA